MYQITDTYHFKCLLVQWKNRKMQICGVTPDSYLFYLRPVVEILCSAKYKMKPVFSLHCVFGNKALFLCVLNVNRRENPVLFLLWSKQINRFYLILSGTTIIRQIRNGGANIHNPGLQAKVAKLGTPNAHCTLIPVKIVL